MNIPRMPTFVREPPDSPIQEAALRILVEFEGGATYVIGTAVIVSGFLAITARHNLEDIVERFRSQRIDNRLSEISNYAVRLYQVLPGPRYVIWQVMTAWPSQETDIAFLHLALFGQSDSDKPIEWRTPRVRVTPPSIGSAVVGHGYHSSRVAITRKADGGYHLDLNDESTATTGVVEEILPTGQPSGKFTFPCFRVGARFDHGMSGGPVFDEAGSLCGIIAGSYGNVEGTPISYVTTLWPMFRTLISANRSGAYPRDVEYPAIDLVLGGQIHAIGLEQLIPVSSRAGNCPDPNGGIGA